MENNQSLFGISMQVPIFSEIWKPRDESSPMRFDLIKKMFWNYLHGVKLPGPDYVKLTDPVRSHRLVVFCHECECDLKDLVLPSRDRVSEQQIVVNEHHSMLTIAYPAKVVA